MSSNDKLGLSSGGDSDVIKADILAKKFQASLSRGKKTLCKHCGEYVHFDFILKKSVYSLYVSLIRRDTKALF